MSFRKLTIAVALALLLAPAAARADGFVSPYIGANFGGDTSDQRLNFGGSVGWMSGGIIGFELDVGVAPDFFGPSDSFADNNVTTLMSNLIVGAPLGGTGRQIRPYASGGIGLMRSRVDGIEGFFDDVTQNDFGFNIGAGAMTFFSDHVGVRGDIRYFRNLSGNSDPDDDFEDFFNVGNFDFWRGTIGVTFKF